jgi:hypothetical protein
MPATPKTLRAPRKVTTVKPAPKNAPVAKAAASVPAKAVKPAPEKRVAKPKVPMHEFKGEISDQTTGLLNTRASRQPINLKKFGTLVNAHLTHRDNEAIASLRKQFGRNPFTRANLDTGILRRLGERGIIAHVSGSEVDPSATFRLTK